MTRATITNKQTGVKLEGEYFPPPTGSAYFYLKLDGTTLSNTMSTFDWDIEEEKPQKFAEALALIEAKFGNTYRRWSEEVRNNRYAWNDEPLEPDIRNYTVGWTSLYRRITEILKDAE